MHYPPRLEYEVSVVGFHSSLGNNVSRRQAIYAYSAIRNLRSS